MAGVILTGTGILNRRSGRHAEVRVARSVAGCKAYESGSYGLFTLAPVLLTGAIARPCL